MSLEGKRLLLLGGTPLMCHVVHKARELGVYTIVTDYYDDVKAPAKKIADEAYDVSTLNVDALVKLARRVRATGVFTGYSDITLMPCRQVCDLLGFPFYATIEQLQRTLNKTSFKELCRAHRIPVVDDIDRDLLAQHPERIDYPIIIKPADSYSSRGISVCHGPDALDSSIERALEVSACKEFLAEKFVVADDVYLYLTVQNGILSLSAMADRILNHEQHGFAPQPIGYLFPSKYIAAYYAQTHAKLQRMIDDLGLRNGTFFLQGFMLQDQLTFFEMGLRLSGGAGYLPIAHENGIDPVKMHIRYALTGEFSGWDVRTADSPHFKRPHFVLVVLLRNGTIGRIRGWDSIMTHPAVFETLRLKNEGDVLTKAGTLEQVFARIYLWSDDQASLTRAVTEVCRSLEITDSEGKNMILNACDEKQCLSEEATRLEM